MIAARHAGLRRRPSNLPPPSCRRCRRRRSCRHPLLVPSRRPRFVLLLLLAATACVRAEWKDCSTGPTVFKARLAAAGPIAAGLLVLTASTGATCAAR